MAEAKCLNCGKKVNLKDKFAGKRIRCPQCGTPVLVGGQGNVRLDRDALRQELARLAESSETPAPAQKAAAQPGGDEEETPPRGTPAKAKPRAKEKTKKPAPAAPPARGGQGPEIREATRSYRGVVLTVLIIVGVAVLGAVGAFGFRVHQKRSRTRRDNMKQEIIASIEAARRSRKPCQEQEALRRYQEAIAQAAEYERTYADGSFIEDLGAMRQEVANLEHLLQSRRQLVQELSESLQRGQTLVKNKQYADARKVLLEAKEEAQGFKSDCEKKQVAQLAERIDGLLESDPVKYGSRGWVVFEDKWRSPADIKKLKEERRLAALRKQEEEYRKKGLVKYNDKWMKPEERELLIARAKEEQEQQAKEKLERLKAMAKRRLDRKKIQELLESDEPVVVISSGEPWHLEDWGNPIEFQTVQEPKYAEEGGDATFLKCYLQRGDKEKWAMAYNISADISGRDYLLADFVVLDRTVNVALAVRTHPQSKYYESGAQRLRKGITRNVRFDLKGKKWKSKMTNWEHKSAIADLDQLYQLCFVIYGVGPAEFLVNNIRIVKGKAPETEASKLPQ